MEKFEGLQGGGVGVGGGATHRWIRHCLCDYSARGLGYSKK
jgi:hypothetical protein